MVPTLDTPTKLEDGSELTVEHIEGALEFIEADEMGALEGKGKKVKGRLGRMIFQFATADTLNENRRIYPLAVVEAALRDFNVRIDKNVVFGNLDHPSVWDPESLSIQLSDAAVKVVEAVMVNDTDIKVVIDILDNKDGQQLKSVLDAKGNPGLSQRALAVWREPNDEERKHHKIPQNEYVVVAEMLRLITYDVVSEAGFSEAHGAKVQEHKKQELVIMTLEEFKAKYPALYNECIALGKTFAAEGLAGKIEAAVTDAKPAIVEEAVKPVQKELDTERVRSTKAVEALTALKPVLVELEIVNEKITDVEAASQLAAAEASKVVMQTTINEQKAANEVLTTQVDAMNGVKGANEALIAVRDKYAKLPAKVLKRILQKVQDAEVTTVEDAIAIADEVVAFLNDFGVGAEKPKVPKTPNAPLGAMSIESLMTGLDENLANPKDSNSGNSTLELSNEIRAGVGKLMDGAIPTLA